MYVARHGRVWSAPFGSEYLGEDSAGIPIVFYRNGWVGPMVPVTPRRIGDPE